MSEREKRKQDEQNIKRLQEIISSDASNQICADCGCKGPRWASVNIGCFLCIRCGGLHRKMGTHISKIKSLTLDSWPPEAIAFMKEMGNAKVNTIYIPQPSKSPTPPTQSDSEMEHYIRQKYEQRRFMNLESRDQRPESSQAIFTTRAEATDYERKYATQLAKLKDMGFTNVGQNIQALKQSHGSLEAAIEAIIATGGVTPSNAITDRGHGQTRLPSTPPAQLEQTTLRSDSRNEAAHPPQTQETVRAAPSPRDELLDLFTAPAPAPVAQQSPSLIFGNQPHLGGKQQGSATSGGALSDLIGASDLSEVQTKAKKDAILSLFQQPAPQSQMFGAVPTNIGIGAPSQMGFGSNPIAMFGMPGVTPNATMVPNTGNFAGMNQMNFAQNLQQQQNFGAMNAQKFAIGGSQPVQFSQSVQSSGGFGGTAGTNQMMPSMIGGAPVPANTMNPFLRPAHPSNALPAQANPFSGIGRPADQSFF